MKSPARILAAIVIAQFLGTSLWFAGNAVLPLLMNDYQWPATSLGYLVTSVQVGFIAGTLLFAVSGVADRFSPSRVFFASCLLGAVSNLVALADLSSFGVVLASRFSTGFFLAGIYPVGMKVAADWKKEGLGNWLGWLVGALVLGTAFPHLLRAFPVVEDVVSILVVVSLLAVTGGLLILVGVPDGPFRKRNAGFSFKAVVATFRIAAFRQPALGYFGHMWELYAFWAFVPFAIAYFNQQGNAVSLDTPVASFLVIGMGALSCGLGGLLSRKLGSARVAFYALAASGICCLLSPIVFALPGGLFLLFLLIWGAAVVADSPQFSSMVALGAPVEMRGSAITIVTCMGFSLTVASIQLLNALAAVLDVEYLFLLLAPGPMLGLLAFRGRSTQPLRSFPSDR